MWNMEYQLWTLLAACLAAQLLTMWVGYALTKQWSLPGRTIAVFAVIALLSAAGVAAWEALGEWRAQPTLRVAAVVAFAVCCLLHLLRRAIERAIETHAECLVREALELELQNTHRRSRR